VDATPFRGVTAVPEAIDHLHNGRNVGKVIVSF
jgi:NADPH-dependent curcumin reductase CurA